MLLARPRGRRLLFAALYMSEGAPMGFLWWALPVRLRTAGVEPEAIASFVALLVVPWALKVFWAPAIDVLRSPRFSVREWIVSAQLVMGATLLPLLFLDLREDFTVLVIALLAHAVAAATQDAAIDTLAIGSIPYRERGAINGWMQVGMLAARALFGGGALIVGNRIGDAPVIGLLILVTWSAAGLLLWGVRRDELPADEERGRRRARLFIGHLGTMLRRRETWLGFAFAVTAGAGFKSLTSIGGPFLIDRGADSDAVGFFFLLPAVGAMAAGALMGGIAADRFGRRAAVALFEGLAAAGVVAIGVAAAMIEPPAGLAMLFVLMGLLYFAIGLATAAAYAMFMDLSDPRLAATQFCAFMAGINLCEAWSTRTLGRLISLWGYGPAFAAMAVPSLLALFLLLWIRVEPQRLETPA